MKKIKITKTLLKKNPDDLLVHLGLVDKKTKSVFPEKLYLSAEDAKILKNNFRNFVKKHNKGVTATFLANIVGYHWLNYGPNESMGDVIRPGVGLIQD